MGSGGTGNKGNNVSPYCLTLYTFWSRKLCKVSNLDHFKFARVHFEFETHPWDARNCPACEIGCFHNFENLLNTTHTF